MNNNSMIWLMIKKKMETIIKQKVLSHRTYKALINCHLNKKISSQQETKFIKPVNHQYKSLTHI